MPNDQTMRSVGIEPGADFATERLKSVAEHTLRYFGAVASDAAEQLGEKRPDAATALAVLNTLTADRAVRNLHGVGEARARELRILATEPRKR